MASNTYDQHHSVLYKVLLHRRGHQVAMSPTWSEHPLGVAMTEAASDIGDSGGMLQRRRPIRDGSTPARGAARNLAGNAEERTRGSDASALPGHFAGAPILVVSPYGEYRRMVFRETKYDRVAVDRVAVDALDEVEQLPHYNPAEADRPLVFADAEM